jgi:hypothetical protein
MMFKDERGTDAEQLRELLKYLLTNANNRPLAETITAYLASIDQSMARIETSLDRIARALEGGAPPID